MTKGNKLTSRRWTTAEEYQRERHPHQFRLEPGTRDYRRTSSNSTSREGDLRARADSLNGDH
jgi:hypothetical protein